MQRVGHGELSSTLRCSHWFVWCKPSSRESNSSFQSHLCASAPLRGPLAPWVTEHSKRPVPHLFPNILSINTALRGIQVEEKWGFLKFDGWVGLQSGGFSVRPSPAQTSCFQSRFPHKAWSALKRFVFSQGFSGRPNWGFSARPGRSFSIRPWQALRHLNFSQGFSMRPNWGFSMRPGLGFSTRPGQLLNISFLVEVSPQGLGRLSNILFLVKVSPWGLGGISNMLFSVEVSPWGLIEVFPWALLKVFPQGLV